MATFSGLPAITGNLSPSRTYPPCLIRRLGSTRTRAHSAMNHGATTYSKKYWQHCCLIIVIGFYALFSFTRKWWAIHAVNNASHFKSNICRLGTSGENNYYWTREGWTYRVGCQGTLVLTYGLCRILRSLRRHSLYSLVQKKKLTFGCFLSTPLLMHGGLICIALRLSVRLSWLDQNSD